MCAPGIFSGQSRKMQEGEELAAMMEDALARFEAAEADEDKNNHLGSQDRVSPLVSQYNVVVP